MRALLRFVLFSAVLFTSTHGYANGEGPCSDLFNDYAGGASNVNGDCTHSVCYSVTQGGFCLTACAPGHMSFTEGACDPNLTGGPYFSECGRYFNHFPNPAGLYQCEACIQKDTAGDILSIDEACQMVAPAQDVGRPSAVRLR